MSFEIRDVRQPMATWLGIILGFLLNFLAQWAIRDDGRLPSGHDNRLGDRHDPVRRRRADARRPLPDPLSPSHEADQARHRWAADALHLASVFGIDDKTALRYAEAARQILETEAERHAIARSLEPNGSSTLNDHKPGKVAGLLVAAGVFAHHEHLLRGRLYPYPLGVPTAPRCELAQTPWGYQGAS